MESVYQSDVGAAYGCLFFVDQTNELGGFREFGCFRKFFSKFASAAFGNGFIPTVAVFRIDVSSDACGPEAVKTGFAALARVDGNGVFRAENENVGNELFVTGVLLGFRPGQPCEWNRCEMAVEFGLIEKDISAVGEPMFGDVASRYCQDLFF